MSFQPLKPVANCEEIDINLHANDGTKSLTSLRPLELGWNGTNNTIDTKTNINSMQPLKEISLNTGTFYYIPSELMNFILRNKGKTSVFF